MITETRLHFQVLGALEVIAGPRIVVIPGERQRQVLAALLLEANRFIAISDLATAIWDDDPPDTARRQVQNAVSQLRKTLLRHGGADVISSEAEGYRLHASADQLDLLRFRALLEQARGYAAGGSPGQAAEVLDSALTLWRGPALVGLTGDSVRRRAVQLDDERLSAWECWAEYKLEVGGDTAVADALPAVVDQNPLRERLVAALVRALNGTGRQAEALSLYHRVAATLAEELGVDPGPELQATFQAVLRGETRPAASRSPDPDTSTRPAQLPAAIAHFTGRAGQLAALDGLLPRPGQHHSTAVVISAINGTAGVGKTALAVQWGHRVADRFPDGQLYVNLRGFDPAGTPVQPAEAVRGFLDALGVPPGRLPDGFDAQAALYRSRIAGKRMLVLLDNARDADQVRPLLPGTPTALTLVTSRNRLAPLVATHGARPVHLDLLTFDEARDMLAEQLGAARVAAEPSAVEDIITACARLPLALAIAAARALDSDAPLATIAAELDKEHQRLDALDAGDDTTRLRAVFTWSYAALTAAGGRLFRLLGLHPGPDISPAAAATLAGEPVLQTRELLAELVRASLLTEHAPGRYSFHDLLRAYATELTDHLEDRGSRRDALRRMLDHYTHGAYAADRVLYPRRDPISLPLAPPAAGVQSVTFADRDAAVAWLTAEYTALLAVQRRAAEDGFDAHAWQLAWALDTFSNWAGHRRAWLALDRAAVEAARRLGEVPAQAYAHRSLARASVELGEYAEALPHLQTALALYEQAGNLVAQAATHRSLAYLYEKQGGLEQALHHAHQAVALCRAAGDRRGEAHALNATGWYHTCLGDHEVALTRCRQALDLLGDDDGHGRAATLDSIAYACHQLGRYAEAVEHYEQALTLLRHLNSRTNEAATLVRLGDVHQALADCAAAQEAWRRALAIFTDLDHPDAGGVRSKIESLT